MSDETTASPATAGLPPTPELDKQHEVIEKHDTQALGTLLEWLVTEGGYCLAKWTEPTSDYQDAMLYDTFDDPQAVLAAYFKIDLKKIDQERQALLEHLRAQT